MEQNAKGVENLFKKIIPENFPNLEEKNIEVQSAHMTQIDMTRKYSSYGIL
jgi:hypothetical protein